MKVSFNPAIKTNSFNGIFPARKKYFGNDFSKPLTKDEIQTARTKKVLSYARYIVLLTGILYFLIKKSMHDSADKAFTNAINKKKAQKLQKPVLDARIKDLA